MVLREASRNGRPCAASRPAVLGYHAAVRAHARRGGVRLARRRVGGGRRAWATKAERPLRQNRRIRRSEAAVRRRPRRRARDLEGQQPQGDAERAAMRGSRDRERRPYSGGGAHAAEIWAATTQRQRRRAAAVALASAVLRLCRRLVCAGSGLVQRLRAGRCNGECGDVVFCCASSGTALSAPSAAAASVAAFAAATSTTAAAAASNLGRLFPPT